MRKPKSRLLAATKLSDYHIKKLIRAYAYGASAAETARNTRISYLTVRRTFDMIRQRLLDLLVYETFREYVQAMDRAEKEYAFFWNEHPLLAFMKESRGKRRGVQRHKADLHKAEWVYRFTKRPYLEGNLEFAHYTETLKLIRISGPLNRPLTPEGKDRALDFLIRRYLEQALRGDDKMQEDRAEIMEGWLALGDDDEAD